MFHFASHSFRIHLPGSGISIFFPLQSLFWDKKGECSAFLIAQIYQPSKMRMHSANTADPLTRHKQKTLQERSSNRTVKIHNLDDARLQKG